MMNTKFTLGLTRALGCYAVLAAGLLLAGGGSLPWARAAEGGTATEVASEESGSSVEKTNAGRLTLERIFSKAEFDAKGAGTLKWLKRGSSYLKLEDGENGGRDLVRYKATTGAREVLVPAHWLELPRGGSVGMEDFKLSDDGARLLIFTNGKRVWRVNSRGDFWVLDLSSRELKQLGGNAAPSTLMFADFSPDGQKVAYVRENNLYVQDLRDWTITALTSDGCTNVINGTFDWVYEEELSLRQGFRWSPDSRQIAYWQLDTTGVPVFYMINNTDGMYPKLIPIPYPKTGHSNSSARVGVVDAEGGETRWLKIPGDPRNHYVARLEWSGTELALQQFNRLQNTNRVMLADVETGHVRTILTETDEAWVENNNEFRWLKDGAGFVWLSENSGWQQAYVGSRAGADLRPITSGNFDVIQVVTVDEDRGWLYFLASPENATQQYLYRAPLQGGDKEQVTPTDQPGHHGYQISGDARFAFHTYSRSDQPPRTELVRLPEHEVIKVMEENTELRDKVRGFGWPPTEFFKVAVEEGVELDAFCIRPPDFDPSKKYPMLIYVYGEPFGATVQDSWKGQSEAWYRMLAEEGYLIVSVDNRGTAAPRGRAWRKSIYRQVGVLASADQAAALRALAERWPYLDRERVAIWGWSGGGSMTLNAIFRYPDLYQTGMAVAPVPNQRLYDTIYQERYMGLPSENPEGYRNGSPIHFAHQLKGNLLLVHGTGDDNCHYQGVEALVNELVRHNKPFSMMAYPNRSHGIHEGENTNRHLFETLTRFLRQHTPPGARER